MVEARWPDSRPVSWNPDLKNGTRCREVYEDQGARISIWAKALSPEHGRILTRIGVYRDYGYFPPETAGEVVASRA